MNVQDMYYKLSQYCNTNVQTLAFMDKSDIINCFGNSCVHKGRYPEINYIKIFNNAKALEISVENSYSEDHLMHTFLDNFHQGGKYSDLIASHQPVLRRE